MARVLFPRPTMNVQLPPATHICENLEASLTGDVNGCVTSSVEHV